MIAQVPSELLGLGLLSNDFLFSLTANNDIFDVDLAKEVDEL